MALGNSTYSEPKGECEYLLIKNLQKIYQSWQDSLESRHTPYYLQLWLYENYVSRSQVVCAIEGAKDFYRNTFELVDEQPKNGIRSSIHYNANTAKYLDCHIWQLSRHIEAYDMTDEDSREMVQETDPSKIIRTDVIEGREYQIVEIDKVWLIV